MSHRTEMNRSVRDVMRTDPLTVTPDTPLSEALAVLLRSGSAALPVVDGETVVGLLAPGDVLRHQARLGHWTELAGTVADAMRTPAPVVSPEDGLAMVHRRLTVEDAGCLAVVERGRLLGVVGTPDLLGWLARTVLGEVQRGPRVADLMTPEPQRARPDDYLVDAGERMSVAGIRHLPVVDAGGRVVGILSDRDVRRALGRRAGAEFEADAPDLTRVSQVMTPDPITIRPEAPLRGAVVIFVDWRIGAVPVVDEEERLVGILSYVDALRHHLTKL